MLVITRKSGEEIKIGDDITIKVVRLAGKAVKIGFEAPKDVKIRRMENSKSCSGMEKTSLSYEKGIHYC